ncbi:4-hydroxy-tetrahydrodipicolinate synthase [Variovorax sp. OV329]|uniref:4-hydroxy-tetrahydrodipicolinate synthase n=1 Tax=Variovorax sp. OV329 TaxID=1882825 RepID=UPI0008EF4C9C|nr:4-hydroxy-tetrahydrodipicolinate synthase [Variovorax sp. OV329]SFM55226.1 4-hydroxy-tetrahydrodipicolinate synthase [Variovorax sp. OV329]
MQQQPSPLTPADFSGLWIPLVTPFRGGAVDHAALGALTRRLAATAIAGFVVCGSTGEAAALDEEEQLAVLDTVIEAAPDLSCVMGVSGYHLGKMLAWVDRLFSRPLAGLLVPPPSYIRPSQSGLIQWFEAIAQASEAPVVVYDIPYRTGATLTLDTLLALAAHPNIRAIKDCGGDARKTQALIADGRLQVLAGEDAQIFATVAQGGAGAIAASAHLETERFVRLIEDIRQGKLAQARGHWQALLPLIDLLFAEPNPGPLKAALAHEGWIADELRLPMTPAGAGLRVQLEQALRRR